MTKLYLDNNGHYKRINEDKICWKSIVAKITIYLIFFSLVMFYTYLLFSA